MTQQTDIDPYYQSGVAGVEHRDVGAAGDEHPFGDEPKEWEADLRPLIRQVSNDLYDSWTATVREYLANAETACLKVQHHLNNPEQSPFDSMLVSDGYEPRITVVWDKSEQKLTIQDNGIGMAAVEVDKVFRQIGRSAARDLGTMSGAFGMGALSFSKFIGADNMMVMVSHSRLNDDNAAYLVTLAGIEPIRGSLDDSEYGTKFTLDQKSSDMEIRGAVEKYAEWMRVPVLYRELDDNGTEVFNEDWGDKRLYDEYDEGKYCDSIVVPGAFEAYMSPDATGRTLLLSMEIERNDGHASSPTHPFDIRILDESGKVVKSSNGNEGLMPVPRIEYEQMLLDARPEYITEWLLSNQDIVAYEAAGDTYDYAIEQSILDSDQPLPRAEYIPLSEGDGQLIGEKLVIMGPHQGREVVSEDEWRKMPEGRAANFVPESELEPFDVDTESGDLCLPEPTTDRSSLDQHDTFWEYLATQFNEEYDRQVDEWRRKIHEHDDPHAALSEMEAQTVSDVRNNAR